MAVLDDKQAKGSWRLPVWFAVPAFLVVAQAVFALALQRGYARTACTDINLLLLILIATAAMVFNAASSHGQRRVFWLLLASGCALWSISLGVYFYYEVLRNQPTPDLSPADVTLFLHIVPFMGAVALRPHVRQERQKLYLNSLSFLLLLLWWLYLYAYYVLPYQYLSWNAKAYNPRFDALYLLESLALLTAIGALIFYSQGSWRKIYRYMFVASALYAFSSEQANSELYLGKFSSGDVYDVLYALAIGWFVLVAVLGQKLQLEDVSEPTTSNLATYASPLSWLAIFSIPALGTWELLQHGHPQWLYDYRLALSFAAIVLLGTCIFLKQYLQDRELVHLLYTSEGTLEKLQRVQAELVQKEKMASLGQLVGGAAHEINNPLTAILGYSDLLAETHGAKTDDVLSIARKIGEQVRRTSAVVSDLVSFAQRSSSDHGLVQVGPLLNQVIDSVGSLAESAKVRLTVSVANDLPLVRGNANQLLQVWRRIVSNAVEAQQEKGGGEVVLSARQDRGYVVVEVADRGPGIREPERVFDPFYTTKAVGKGTGLGLSVCYGIVQDHQGQVSCRNRPEGGAIFEVRLPAADDTQPAIPKRN